MPRADGEVVLTATLTRPGAITAADITLTHREPTLALRRARVDAGHPDQPMTVVDSATGWPTMHVRSIARAALLTVDEGHDAGSPAGGRFPARGALQEWPLTMPG